MRTLLLAVCFLSGACCYVPAPAPHAAEPPQVEEPAPPQPIVLPASIAPLGEGGEVTVQDAENIHYRFTTIDFPGLRERTTTWLLAHGWTVVPGSEVDEQIVARGLEEMGQAEAARLARERPSFGASYQHAGCAQTLAVTIDSLDGLRLMLSWF